MADRMRSDWDKRARDNARHFVATAHEAWTDEAFFADGRHDIQHHILPFREWICRGREFSELRMLEIGCGAGRMTKGLGETFGAVDAVDVSPEMVVRARAALTAHSNVRVHVGSGTDLAMFPDASFDFVFSVIVFQHIPSKAVVANYVGEAHRVLRPGCIFRFQAQGYPIPEEKADTWVGVGFSADEMQDLAARTGFEILDSTGAGTQDYWLTFRKC
jgi:SAM-dependent methyltransferase